MNLKKYRAAFLKKRPVFYCISPYIFSEVNLQFYFLHAFFFLWLRFFFQERIRCRRGFARFRPFDVIHHLVHAAHELLKVLLLQEILMLLKSDLRP